MLSVVLSESLPTQDCHIDPRWPQSTVASISVHSSLKSLRKYTLSYFFIVLIKHHDQETCRRKGLFDYSSRGL